MEKEVKGYALITGASGGIGRALALQFAQHKIPLILVARREPELLELNLEIKNMVGRDLSVVYACDLTNPSGFDQLMSWIKDQNLHIKYLVNNAGYGNGGAFLSNPEAQEVNLLHLNIEALVKLCHTIGNQMKNRGGGFILNVGSTAGYLPGPFLSTYYASKAFVNSFTQSLHEELRPFGISVTLLAPGPVETAFVDRAGIGNSPLFKRLSVMTAETVAKSGFFALQKKQAICVPGLQNKLLIWSLRITPAAMARRISGFLNHAKG